MKVVSKILIAVLISLSGLQARADETPVFVSCYSDAGEHLQLIFDTARTEFSYRYAMHQGVDLFDAAPQGSLGYSSSRVSKYISDNHIELKAQIIGGDVITPIITASAQVTFDRDETGSLKLTSYSIYHLSQPYDISSFMVGVCYVQ